MPWIIRCMFPIKLFFYFIIIRYLIIRTTMCFCISIMVRMLAFHFTSCSITSFESRFHSLRRNYLQVDIVPHLLKSWHTCIPSCATCVFRIVYHCSYTVSWQILTVHNSCYTKVPCFLSTLLLYMSYDFVIWTGTSL